MPTPVVAVPEVVSENVYPGFAKMFFAIYGALSIGADRTVPLPTTNGGPDEFRKYVGPVLKLAFWNPPFVPSARVGADVKNATNPR
jgi:hypothetical protein